MSLLLAILLSQTDLTIVMSCEPHCQAAREQWNSQYRRDSHGLLYQQRFARELSYLHKHFHVHVIDETQYPTRMQYPVIRYGRGGEEITLRRMACFPGHFLTSLGALSRDYRYEMSTDYRNWKTNRWQCDRPTRPSVTQWAHVEERPVYAPIPRYWNYPDWE